MNRKNILAILLSLICIICFVEQANAASLIPHKDANVTVTVQADEQEECDETELIKRFSLRDKFKKSPEGVF